MENSDSNKKTFTFTKEIDGKRKTFKGRQVENGWLVSIDMSWDETDPFSGAVEYKQDCKEYITKENPLDKLQKDKLSGESGTVPSEDISAMIKDISSMEGMLLVD